MKRLLGVVLVLFMACFPMNIHAEEVDLSFEYTGQKIEVENAAKYYTTAGVLLDKAPTDCGTYIAGRVMKKRFYLKSNLRKCQ